MRRDGASYNNATFPQKGSCFSDAKSYGQDGNFVSYASWSSRGKRRRREGGIVPACRWTFGQSCQLLSETACAGPGRRLLFQRASRSPSGSFLHMERYRISAASDYTGNIFIGKQRWVKANSLIPGGGQCVHCTAPASRAGAGEKSMRPVVSQGGAVPLQEQHEIIQK